MYWEMPRLSPSENLFKPLHNIFHCLHVCYLYYMYMWKPTKPTKQTNEIKGEHRVKANVNTTPGLKAKE